MPAPVSETTKRLHGTTHKRPAPASVGTPRLQHAIAPPSDLPPELRPHWKRHMLMAMASGRAATVDLLAFAELVKAAHMADLAYSAAVTEGPTVMADKGQTKTGSAWRAYMLSAANYRIWLDRFGLTPKGRGVVKQLPALAEGLHLVDNRG